MQNRACMLLSGKERQRPPFAEKNRPKDIVPFQGRIGGAEPSIGPWIYVPRIFLSWKFPVRRSDLSFYGI